MSDWRFGTVLHRPLEGKVYVMVIRQNHSSENIPTTDSYDIGVPPDGWLGLTLAPGNPMSATEPGPWGTAGSTTWLLDDRWVVVDD